MRFLYLFIFSLMTISLNAQIASSCQTDSVLLENHEKTVKGLALERVYEFNHSDTQSVEVPQIWQDSIMEAIAAVYNIATSERDSVFAIYCIKDYKYENGRRGLYAYPNTNIGWVYDWIFNDSTIVDANFKAFILQHNLEIDKTLILNSSIAAVEFYTDDVINLNRIVDTFMTYSFFGIIEANSFTFGDGNHVYYSTVGHNRYIDFELGWGDCPLGCTARRTWSFEVLPDCSVNFINSFGSSTNPNPMFGNPPSATNCYPTNTKNEKKIFLTNVNIYPNPANDYFQIEIETDKIENFQLEIYDIVGRQEATKRIQNLDKIDITELSNGLHIVVLKNENGQVVWNSKIVKE